MNETLQLSLQVQTTGVQEVNRLADGLSNVVSISERAGRSIGSAFAGVPQNITQTTTALSRMHPDLSTIAAMSLTVAGAMGKLTVATIAHGSAAESTANTWRALRLAVSPTPFTAATIAAGILTEQLIRMTNARAVIIQQQALFAATARMSFGSVDRLDSITSAAGGDSSRTRSLFGDLSQRSISHRREVETGLSAIGISASSIDKLDPALLGKIAGGFADMENPIKRAAAAVALFGTDKAADALKDLNPSFATASQAVERFGVVMDETARNHIYAFRREFLTLKGLFDFSGEKAALETFGKGAGVVLADLTNAAGNSTGAIEKWIRTFSLVQSFRGWLSQDNQLPGPPAIAGSLGQRHSARTDQTVTHGAEGSHADELWAISNGVAFRESETLAGQRKLRDAKQAEASAAAKKLTEDDQVKYLRPREGLNSDERLQLAVLQQSSDRMARVYRDRVETLEEADLAEKKATQAAEELAQWRSKSGERLKSMAASSFERSLHDPIAQQIVRGSAEVLRDSDRSTVEERSSRSEIQNRTLSAIVQEEQSKFGKEWERSVIEAEQERRKWFSQNLGDQIQRDERFIAAAERARTSLNAGDSQDFAGVRSTAEHYGRMASLTAGPGGEVAALREALTLRQDGLGVERAIIKLAGDRYDQTVEMARLDREEQDAKWSFEERLAELRKKNIADFRSNVVAGFDDLVSGKGGNILKSFGVGIQRQVLGNLAEEVYPRLQKAMSGMHFFQTGLAGRLAAGTPFGADPLKGATDANTAATIANTAALGRGVASMATGAMGAIGGGGLFSGSDPNNPYIFHANDPGVVGTAPNGPFAPDAIMTGKAPSSMLPMSTAAKIGIASAAAGGGFAAYDQFRHGDLRGAVGGVGALAGTAGSIMMMAGLSGPAAPIVMGVGLALGMVTSLIGDPKKIREHEIQMALERSVFHAPTALNATMDGSGNYADFDARGGLRRSNLRGMPSTTDPYTTWRNGSPYEVPGSEVSPYQKVEIHIHTVDSEGMEAFTRKHSTAIANAVAGHLDTSEGSLSRAVRFVAGGQ